MARATSWFLAATLLIAGILAALLWREHNALRAAEREVTRLSVLEYQRQNTSAPVSRPAASLPPASAAAATAPPVAAPVAAEPAPASARTYSESERRARAQMTEYRRWMTLAKKAELLSGLNLPPEKLAGLKDLLIERDFAERDAREAAKAAGVHPNDAAESETNKIDERIRTMLGEADYPKYADAMSAETFRQMLEANPLVGCLVDAGAPLTSEQKAWVAQVMNHTIAPVAKAAADNPAVAPPDPDVPRLAFQQAVLTQGSGVLTPLQLSALREFFRKDNELGLAIKAMTNERQRK